MVLLTVTPATKAALDEYCNLSRSSNEYDREETQSRLEKWSNIDLGSPIDHADLIGVSKYLVQNGRRKPGQRYAKEWRLDSLLKGSAMYQPSPPPKPEPSSEYQALMKRLRAEEEQRQYERMINPLQSNETFGSRFPTTARSTFAPTHLGPIGVAGEPDEVTYADINRQMTLIINVLVSIICCSIAIWIAARRWDVPQRLGLSMSGSGLVAIAEVAIYMGYIRRVKDAKGKETKKFEKKEIVETWVLDGTSSKAKNEAEDGMRYRKGKHR